jgi:hypothetical protein
MANGHQNPAIEVWPALFSIAITHSAGRSSRRPGASCRLAWWQFLTDRRAGVGGVELVKTQTERREAPDRSWWAAATQTGSPPYPCSPSTLPLNHQTAISGVTPAMGLCTTCDASAGTAGSRGDSERRVMEKERLPRRKLLAGGLPSRDAAPVALYNNHHMVKTFAASLAPRLPLALKGSPLTPPGQISRWSRCRW